MSVPSQKDVSMMANLMKVMNGETVKLQEDTTSTNPNHVDISPGVKRADVDAMAKIMAGFNEATTSVAHKVKKTITESTKTEKGVKVGAFSVEKNKEGRYDILDTRSDSLLFQDIQLYETVCCIANHLNEGKTINSQEIMEIIRINDHYLNVIIHQQSSIRTHIKWPNVQLMKEEWILLKQGSHSQNMRLANINVRYPISTRT